MLKSLSLDRETRPPALRPLADKPLTVIEPGKPWKTNFRDLWRYRELFYFLIWRDIKVRYKQTALGIVWVVLQPALTTIVFTVFFGVLARVPSGGRPYALLAYTGLLPWTFFSNAVAGGANSLVTNASLITKVYFPRMLIPVAAVGARLVDFAIALLCLIPLMIYFNVKPTLNLSILPFLILLLTWFSVGIIVWLSALNVRFRDVGIVIPMLVQLWMFVTPVAYSSDLIPRKWQWLYFLNPLAGIVENFRAAILGLDFHWMALAYSTIITLFIFVHSAYFFRRMERTFSDII
jgi:homopolymeric O-antigen transport system permease protein